ncbi:rap1 GTPase-activating protein 1-like, partial [Haplochromis burtoni]|uniref:rap1 GTPase-activating protein 1-like n=1 Tax=Haplochromis burtoni TaxID=8153 RepID=UPI001C2D3147
HAFRSLFGQHDLLHDISYVFVYISCFLSPPPPFFPPLLVFSYVITTLSSVSSLLFCLFLSHCFYQSLLVPGKSPSKYGRRGSAIGIGTVEESLIIPGKSPTRKKSGPFSSRRSSAIGIENIQEVQEKSRDNSPNTQKTPDSGHASQDPKSDNSSNQSSPEVLTTTKNSSYLVGRAASIPEAHDLSRSSSNASSFASVVEENETEATEEYDTGMESLSSAGTPHKRDSFPYNTWLEDNNSNTTSTSRGSSPGPGKPDRAKGMKLERSHNQQSSSNC